MADGNGLSNGISSDYDNTDSVQSNQDDNAGLRSQLEKLIRCHLCSESVKDPKSLDCRHIYCAACIPLVADDDKIICRTCQEEFPVGDVRERDDYLATEILKLLEDYKHSMKVQPVENGRMVEVHTEGESVESNDTGDDNTLEIEKRTQHSDAASEPQQEVVPNDQPADDEQAALKSPPASVEDASDPPPLHLNGSAETDTRSESDNTDRDTASTPEQRGLNPSSPLSQKSKDSLTSSKESLSTSETNNNGSLDHSLADEPDSKMKSSEIKPMDVKTSLANQIQCGACNKTSCDCNCSPSPASPMSIQSVEQNISRSDSEADIDLIPIERMSTWAVDSACHVEVVNKNQVHVTKWTYDDSGSISTFDVSGKKIKFIHGNKHNYSGIAYSGKGSLLALNTTKRRFEEYNSSDGRKLSTGKLESCHDPQAVDVMSSGEILVVDQDKNAVIVYSGSRQKQYKILTHDLMKRPYDIACYQKNFFVTCPATRSVLKFDLDGKLLWSCVSSSQLKVPQGVCVDEEGNLYVVDKVGRKVMVFDVHGNIKGKLQDKELGPHRKPWYISVRNNFIAVLHDHNVVRTYRFA